MPQVITHVSEAFSFDELDDAAKERARDWYRECIDEYDFSCEVDEFVQIGEAIGIDFTTHTVQLMGGKTREEPNIWYDVSCCQGSGACFEGTYRHNGTSCARIREHLSDEEVLRITDELNRIQSARILLGWPTLEAVMTHRGHYYHAHSIDFDVTTSDDDPDVDWSTVEADEKLITELMRDLMRWLYKRLCEQRDWLYSDEAVDESITANEYMFDEEGHRHAYA